MKIKTFLWHSLLIVTGITQALFCLQFSQEYRSTGMVRAAVGVVTIEGSIESSELYVDQLTYFFKDPRIAAIVIKISSPGGSPGGAEAIHQTILNLKKKYQKPVIIWVESLCASAGYFIASAADCIIATRSALIGSIGVIFQTWRLRKFLENFDIFPEIITAGEHKDFGNWYIDPTENRIKATKQLLAQFYTIFVSAVQSARPQLALLPQETWAEGQIFCGEKALELGLIDKIGCQDTVKDTVKELAHINGGIEWIHPPESEESQSTQESDSRSALTLSEQPSETIMLLLKEIGFYSTGIRMELIW